MNDLELGDVVFFFRKSTMSTFFAFKHARNSVKINRLQYLAIRLPFLKSKVLPNRRLRFFIPNDFVIAISFIHFVKHTCANTANSAGKVVNITLRLAFEQTHCVIT